MSLSYEWTEYHLTPNGWESGSGRYDGQGTTPKDPPTNRVLTVRWIEDYPSGGYGKPHKVHEELWRSADTQTIEKLNKRFGDPPKQL
jgi:hypothetical protein